jgi:quercetin dioxygenase-like cupin family protein
MEIETIRTEPPFSKNDGSYNSSLLTFDLPTLISKMKLSNSWLNGDLNAMILLKSPGKQIMLTALHKGIEISSFQVHDSITLQIIEGKLKFHTREESVTLDRGQLLTLHEKIKYGITSSEETVFLLTIAKSTFRQSDN